MLWLRHMWNAPNSLWGLLGGIGGRWRRDRENGVATVIGGWLIRALAGCGWAEAITLGDVILYANEAARREWHAHEMVHVRQGRRWGVLFLPTYALESLYQWLRTGQGYRSNRFEQEAYASDAERFYRLCGKT